MLNLSHTIRKFNRFELKYIVPIQAAERFKQDLCSFLAPDEHGDSLGAYGVSSLYYDGPDYRFYWEKIDGIKFRRKLRIRHYENGDPLTEKTPVFVEIKQRLNRVSQKRRLQLPYGDALHLCSQRQLPEPDAFNHDPSDAAVIDEVLAMSWQYDLRPASIVSYNRQAMIGGQYDVGLRVTFDKDLTYLAAGEGPSALQLNGERAGLTLFTADMVIIEIKFDEFISGQTYQGYSRLAIRSAGISYDASMLQEPITNSIFRLVGLPAAQTAYTGLKLNEDAEQLFIISEVIDETYLESHFNNLNGVLYKAELNATMAYQGEDPSAYANSFTQETRQNDADFAPLVAFLRFLSESDDPTFASQLPEYLDIESFAAYLAINNLLVNTDSMAGMGNNFYLYYDDISERMTVLMWDANEGLGKLGGSATYDLYFQGGTGIGGRMGSGSNQLITRFLANPTFKALYEAKLEQVYQQAFLSGIMEEQIQVYTNLITQANQERALVDQNSYDLAVADVLDFITQRSAYLNSTSLLGGQASLPQ